MARYGQEPYGKIQSSYVWQDAVRRRVTRYSQAPYGKTQSNDVWPHTVRRRMARYSQTTCGKIQSDDAWQLKYSQTYDKTLLDIRQKTKSNAVWQDSV